jgi:hypothetical protein
MTHRHPHEQEDDDFYFSAADRFDGFDRGDLDNVDLLTEDEAPADAGAPASVLPIVADRDDDVITF